MSQYPGHDVVPDIEVGRNDGVGTGGFLSPVNITGGRYPNPLRLSDAVVLDEERFVEGGGPGTLTIERRYHLGNERVVEYLTWHTDVTPPLPMSLSRRIIEEDGTLKARKETRAARLSRVAGGHLPSLIRVARWSKLNAARGWRVTEWTSTDLGTAEPTTADFGILIPDDAPVDGLANPPEGESRILHPEDFGPGDLLSSGPEPDLSVQVRENLAAAASPWPAYALWASGLAGVAVLGVLFLRWRG